MRRTCLLTATLALATFAAPATADLSVSTVRDVTIEDASVMRIGPNEARLKFHLANASPEPVVLIGLEAGGAARGDLSYNSHHGDATPLTELVLLPDEEADFATSHLQARLFNVDLDGGAVAFRIIFRKGAVDGRAHVH